MKIKSIILLAALLLTISPQGIHAGDNPLIGEWVSATRSKGGLGGSRYYKEGGTVIATYGALIDYKYKISGNILSLFNQSGELSSEQKFQITGQDLLLKDIKTGQEQKLIRVEGDTLSSIIGKWVSSNDTGKKYCMHFTKGLNCYFAVPLDQAKAKYKVNGDIYIEESAEKGKTEWKISIKDDLLTLTKKDGSKIEEYKKKK